MILYYYIIYYNIILYWYYIIYYYIINHNCQTYPQRRKTRCTTHALDNNIFPKQWNGSQNLPPGQVLKEGTKLLAIMIILQRPVGLSDKPGNWAFVDHPTTCHFHISLTTSVHHLISISLYHRSILDTQYFSIVFLMRDFVHIIPCVLKLPVDIIQLPMCFPSQARLARPGPKASSQVTTCWSPCG